MRRYRLAAAGSDWHNEQCTICTQINEQVKNSTALRSMPETEGVLANLIGESSSTSPRYSENLARASEAEFKYVDVALESSLNDCCYIRIWFSTIDLCQRSLTSSIAS